MTFFPLLDSLVYSPFYVEEGSIALKSDPLRFSQIQMKWDQIKALHLTGVKAKPEGVIPLTLLTLSYSEC